MKKVLIITYYFPPSGGAGVQRVLKFVKYLPALGWQPLVLTVREDADFPARDPSLAREIPGEAQVIRTPIFEPYNVYRMITGRKKGEATDIASMQNSRRSLGEQLSEWVRSTFFIPDARCFWRRPAVRAGLKIIQQEKPDVILSSAPPYTCHLIGQALHQKSGLPWVADFRDSWVDWLSAPQRRGLSRAIDGRMERRVLEKATRLLTVSRGVRDDLLSRSPHIAKEAFSLLGNGFDGDDFEGISGASPQDRFTLTYTGSLYGKRNPLTLLAALDELLKEDPDMGHALRLRFVGRVDPDFLCEFERFGPMIEYIPYVSHEKSIEYLLNSTALLLIIDDSPVNRGILTGKLYEYIGARRPIMALAPPGEAVDLIHRVQAGQAALPHDLEAVKSLFKTFYQKWKSGTLTLPDNREAVAALERRGVTRELAALLDSMIKEPS